MDFVIDKIITNLTNSNFEFSQFTIKMDFVIGCSLVMCDIHDMNIYRDINDGDMIYEIFLYRDFMIIKKWQLTH